MKSYVKLFLDILLQKEYFLSIEINEHKREWQGNLQEFLPVNTDPNKWHSN